MSLRCVGSQSFRTAPSALLLGSESASLSIRVRINPGSPPPLPDGVRLFGDDGGAVSVGLTASNALRVAWTSNDGSIAIGTAWEQAILPGVAYHLVATWQDGVQHYYLNGLLVASGDGRGPLGRPGPPLPRPIRIGTDVAGVDVTLGEAALWSGYALTAEDAVALRDRATAPEAVAPASVALSWSLAGPSGVAKVGDPGLVDRSANGLALVGLAGSPPSYAADGLAIEPRGITCEASVCPSGEMVLFLFRDQATIPTNVVDLGSQLEAQSLLMPTTSSRPIALGLGDQATPPIAPVEVLPPSYFEWRFAVPAPGQYDIAVYLPFSDATDQAFRVRQALYEVRDSGSLVGQTTLDQTRGSLIGTSFTDGTTKSNGRPAAWIPLGRFAFSSTVASVRMSGNPTAPYVFESLVTLDSLLVKPAGGGPSFRVGPDSPPAVAVGGSFQNSGEIIPGSSRGGYTMQTSALGSTFRFEPAAIQAALEALPRVGPGNVVVTGGDPGSPMRVDFVGALAGLAMPLLASTDPSVVVGRISAGASWPRISINGGAPIALIRPFWGAGHGDVNRPEVRTHNPYLPFVVFPFYQQSPAASYEQVYHHSSTLRGNWDPTDTPGYSPRVVTSSDAGATSGWKFEALNADRYRISASWPANPSGPGGRAVPAPAADVLFTVTDGTGAVLGTYHVDQSSAPEGPVDQGVPWHVLGDVTLASPIGDLAVTMSSGSAGLMVADAVRCQRLSPDASIRLAATDVVTCTTGDGWAITKGGPAVGMTAAPVANKVGGTIYPPVGDSPQSMRVGLNINLDGPGMGGRIYANLAKAWVPETPVTLDDDGYPVRFDSPYRDYDYAFFDTHVVNPPIEAGGPYGGGGRNLPSGRYTLKWDGASELLLVGYGKIAEVGTPVLTGGVGNRRVFDVQADPGAFTPTILLRTIRSSKNPDKSFNVDARNVEIYPPGVDPDNPPKYLPGFLDKIRAAHSLRFLDPIGAINGNNVTFDDYFPSPTRFSKVHPQRTPTVPVVEVRAHPFGTAPKYDPTQGPAFEVTTGAPHGLSDGMVVQFAGEPGPAQLSNGTVAGLQGVFAAVHVLSPTTFAFQDSLGLPRDSNGQVIGQPIAMTNVVANAGGAIQYRAGNGMPMQDMVELCNLANNGEGADIYINTGISVDDDCLTRMATYVARNLKPGRKVRLEYTNEIWNSGAPPSRFMSLQGVVSGLSTGDPVPYYCRQAAHHWSVFGAAMQAAGRGGDLIRVVGSQAAYFAITDNLARCCREIGVTFDELAVAPYLGNGSSYANLGPAGEALPEHVEFADRLTPEQDLDMLEANYTYGAWDRTHVPHRALLDAQGFLGVRLSSYEGGPDVLAVTPPGRQASRAITRSHAIHRHPRAYHWILHVLRGQQGSGIQVYHFYFLAGIGDYPFPGNVIPVWGMYTSTAGQLPGTGDPALDADNIRTPERLDLVKSEIGGAFNRWASLVGAAPPPRPPAPYRSVPGRNGLLRTTGLPRGLSSPTR